MRGRLSRFDGATVASRLASGSLGLDPWPLSHVEVAGGTRQTRVTSPVLDDREWWESVDVDLALGRRWYWNGGWEHDHGGSSGQTRQLQGGLSLRF